MPGRYNLGTVLGRFGQGVPFDQVEMEGGRVGGVANVVNEVKGMAVLVSVVETEAESMRELALMREY